MAQVSEVAEVAAEWPMTEQQLLNAAEVMSLSELREECRRVKAAHVSLSGRFTPDEGARLLAEVDVRCGGMERDARAGDGTKGTTPIGPMRLSISPARPATAATGRRGRRRRCTSLSTTTRSFVA